MSEKPPTLTMCSPAMLLLALVSVLALTLFPAVGTSEITILAPSVGYVADGTVDIRWNATNTSGSVDIFYSHGPDNENWTLIAGNISADPGNASHYSISGYFTIRNDHGSDGSGDGGEGAAMVTLAAGITLAGFLFVFLWMGGGRKGSDRTRESGQPVEDERAGREQTERVLEESGRSGAGAGIDAKVVDAGITVTGDEKPGAPRKNKLRCPGCRKIIASDVRPITVQCPGCGKKMTIRG